MEKRRNGEQFVTKGAKLHIYLLNLVVRIVFFSILQIS